MRSRVVLPLPDDPRIALIEPGRDGQVDVGEDVAGAEALGHRGALQIGHAGAATAVRRVLPNRLIST